MERLVSSSISSRPQLWHTRYEAAYALLVTDVRILVIAEKDSVGRALAGAVLAEPLVSAPRYTRGQLATNPTVTVLITWPNGHAFRLVDPEAYNPRWGGEWNEDVLPVIPPAMDFRYSPVEAHFAASVADWASRADEVVNACDAAREGELIFAEILRHVTPSPKCTISRMWIKATTADGLRAAWTERENGRKKKYGYLAEAGYARQHADWVWGINFTRKVTLALGRRYPRETGGRTYHVGRVQTPVLRIVKDRHDKILDFEVEEFARLNAVFSGSGGRFQAKIVAFQEDRFGNTDTHFRSVTAAQAMRSLLIQRMQFEWKVQDMIKPSESHAPPPFALDDLQQSANMIRTLNFTAKETLDLAQRLYAEEKAITYPRTTSCFFPQAMRGEVFAVRDKLMREWLPYAFAKAAELPRTEPPDNWFDDSKVSDHHAIMPTGVIPEPLNDRGRLRPEYVLWQLITMRFIHAWCAPAIVYDASRFLLLPLSPDLTARATLTCNPVAEPGWLQMEELTFNTRGHGDSLAKLRQERIFPECAPPVARLESMLIEPAYTTKPLLHDDAHLLREMAEFGLGTPATRAQCIEDLLARGYLLREQNNRLLISTDGSRLIELLQHYGGTRLCDTALTASWEQQLERIELQVKEKPTRESFLAAVTEEMRGIFSELDGAKNAEHLVFCPNTGKKVVLSDDGKRWIFYGRLKDAFCPVTMRDRQMSAMDYRDIFIAGAKGGGPFTFKSKRTGNDYETWIVFKAKRSGYDQWEFRLKSRGIRTKSDAPAPSQHL